VQPEDLDALLTPGRPSLHPGGRRAVVSVVRPDIAADEYIGQLWTVDVPAPGTAADTGTAVRLTRGHRDAAPRHSPDGTLVAFLRAAPRGRAQLHVVAAGGGEPLALTDAPLGVTAFSWSPDGTRIAFTARVPEAGRYLPGGDPGAEAPRLFTHLRHAFDGIGYLPDRRSHVFLVSVPDPDGGGVAIVPSASVPAAVQLTDGDADDENVVFGPDGTTLAFTSARHDHRHADLFVDAFTLDLGVLDVSGGSGSGAGAAGAGDGGDGADGRGERPSPERVTTTTLTVSEVAWTADGTGLWLRASDPGPTGRGAVARQDGLYRVGLDAGGPQQPELHTDFEAVDLGEVFSHLTVTATGVLVQARHRGSVQLLRVPTAGGAPELVLDGPLQVLGHDAAQAGDGEVIVAAVASASSCGELVVLGPDSADSPDGPGGLRTLTDFSAALRERTAVQALHELTALAPDGEAVHGWVVLPDGAGPHPVLLDIHGGPFTQFGWSLYDEAQVLAGAGYAVLLCNPRGSAGYGAAHGAAIAGRFGTLDLDDVTAFLDTALAERSWRLDASRLGVLGGSYGGYLTSWITTRPEVASRFSAAVVERGFLDPATFAGTSDIGWFFGDEWCGTDPGALAAQSPMAHVAAVRTPTLVIHSEQDLRCPIEAGQRWFAALVRQGVPAELLVFPGESHGLTRTGRPAHRRARFEHLLRWFAAHLPVPAADPASTDPASAVQASAVQAGAAPAGVAAGATEGVRP